MLVRTRSGLAPSSNNVKGQVFTTESTKVTFRQACNMVGLDPTDARLMRLGANAVFRLVDPVVVRIARLDNLDEMTRTSESRAGLSLMAIQRSGRWPLISPLLLMAVRLLSGKRCLMGKRMTQFRR